jgi:hypothetical protein
VTSFRTEDARRPRRHLSGVFYLISCVLTAPCDYGAVTLQLELLVTATRTLILCCFWHACCVLTSLIALAGGSLIGRRRRPFRFTASWTRRCV